MNPIDVLLSEPFGQTLGWTLLHFVWQGALVAFLLALALYPLRHRTAQTRYVVACGALLLLLAMPVVTFAVLLPDAVETTAALPAPVPEPTTPQAEALPPADALAAAATPASWQQEAGAMLAAALPWLVLLWMTGVLALSMRYLAGWTYTIRLRRRRTREVGQQWHRQLEYLARRMGVRRTVRLVSSALVQVPMVAGWLRPMILLPVSVFTGLSPRQIEMIIAHELAHIRRHDYLMGLLQAACETVLFYHPAVWWVSERIRTEREHCCDDLVVSVCGDAFTYVSALAKMETARQAAPRLAMAATGGPLLDRVRRLLEGPAADPSPRAARWFAGLAVLATFLVSIYLSSAFNDAWDETHTWINEARTEQTAPNQGLLHIHTRDERDVLLEDLRGETPKVFTVHGPEITVHMPAGAQLGVFADNQPVKGEFDPEEKTITFTGDLVLETWKDTRQLQRITTYNAVLVYVLPPQEEALERYPMKLPNGYETTARLLEELIFERRKLRVQLEALDELRNLPKRAALPSLITIAERHPRQPVRLEAAQWLGRLGDAFVVLTLEGIAFDDHNAAVQLEALDALSNLSDKIGWPSLIKIAQTHPRAAMRSEAVQAFGRLGDEAARTTLNYILYADPDEDVQRETFDALMSLPAGIASWKLEQIAENHPSEDIRREALDELKQRRMLEALQGREVMRPDKSWGTHQSTAERLEALIFSDESETVQLEALEALANLHGDAALPSLKKIAQTHPNERTRRKATDQMGRVEAKVAASQQDQATWNEALEGLKHKQVDRRITAVKTLEDLKSRNVFSTLGSVVFTDPSQDVQREALDAIRDRSGASLEAMALLARIIRTHPDPEIRIEAVQSIDNMSAEDRLPLLEEVIFRDDDLDVRAEALYMLIDAEEAEAWSILARLAQRENLPRSLREAAAEALDER